MPTLGRAVSWAHSPCGGHRDAPPRSPSKGGFVAPAVAGTAGKWPSTLRLIQKSLGLQTAALPEVTPSWGGPHPVTDHGRSVRPFKAQSFL